jgi:hypothetical protein
MLPNLVGLLGALGDIDDLEGCSEKNRQHKFKVVFEVPLPNYVSSNLLNSCDRTMRS